MNLFMHNVLISEYTSLLNAGDALHEERLDHTEAFGIKALVISGLQLVLNLGPGQL